MLATAIERGQFDPFWNKGKQGANHEPRNWLSSRAMVGPLLLLAAAALPQSAPAAVPEKSASVRPSLTVSARATARITVISGVKFGAAYSAVPASAQRRSASLTDYDGQVRSAELLEFQ
jgi:hypothetical protein